jgi:chromate transport protein ChrA
MDIKSLNYWTLAYYTGKWTLIWSFKFTGYAIIIICALLTFIMACVPTDGKSNS